MTDAKPNDGARAPQGDFAAIAALYEERKLQRQIEERQREEVRAQTDALQRIADALEAIAAHLSGSSIVQGAR